VFQSADELRTVLLVLADCVGVGWRGVLVGDIGLRCRYMLGNPKTTEGETVSVAEMANSEEARWKRVRHRFPGPSPQFIQLS
jgi:hypothetical protein